MIYPHYEGNAVLAEDKLYVFCGRSEIEFVSGTGTRDAEVYDFQEKEWEDLPKTPQDYNVDIPQLVALPNKEILLVGGRWPGLKYARTSYIYNTEARQYTHAGNRDTVEHRGTVLMGCALMPDGLRVICAGGFNDCIFAQTSSGIAR